MTAASDREAPWAGITRTAGVPVTAASSIAAVLHRRAGTVVVAHDALVHSRAVTLRMRMKQVAYGLLRREEQVEVVARMPSTAR